jgi:hypothetical protein
MALMQPASDARPGRAAAVARFQTELPEESRYMLASLKAGGVGVTLTAANHAIGDGSGDGDSDGDGHSDDEL